LFKPESEPQPNETTKLACIMFADMVGYTRIMQESESKAFSLLNEISKIVSEKIQNFNGRLIKKLGDGFLVEFTSAKNALFCAVEIQDKLRRRNQNKPEDEKVFLRIGLHTGEVTEKDNDVYGDAVNIASRVVSMAEPSGICMTEQVYQLVSNKINLNYVSLGQKYLKNVLNPVELYSVSLSDENDSRYILPLSRLAVLPFVNISPDPSDEYFADGLTEELIFRLSRIRGISVIARTSIMQYKNKMKKVSEIGRELGAGLIIEGSVRKASDRIRVTVQLIDANNEEHLWAETYERKLDDLFRVQEEIVSRIAESLPQNIRGELRHERKDTESTEAYLLFLKASQLINAPKGESIKQALELYRKAVEIDPNFARAYLGISDCYILLGEWGYLSYEDAINGAKQALNVAARIEPELPEVHSALAGIAWFEDEFDIMEKECRKALELKPSFAEAYFLLSLREAFMDNISDSVNFAEKAHSLDPSNSFYIYTLLRACLYSGQEEKFLLLCNENSGTAPYYVSILRCEYYMSKKEFEKAETELRLAENLAPYEALTLGTRGMLEALKGDGRKAHEIIEMVQSRFSSETYVRWKGLISYLLGDTDTYYACMLESAKNHTLDVFRYMHSPLFKEFRKDKRFQEVLSAVKPRLSES
jgi:adenylate cyclase